MPVIDLTCHINAPVERVFDLSRSIDLHVESMRQSKERVVAGVTSGLINMGEEVTWEARHFGIRFKLTSRIVNYDRSVHFRDAMIDGPFVRFDHDHIFEQTGQGTRMRDRFDYTAPCGVLGRVVDRLVLRAHMQRLLMARNRRIKEVAETDAWKPFLFCA